MSRKPGQYESLKGLVIIKQRVPAKAPVAFEHEIEVENSVVLANIRH